MKTLPNITSLRFILALLVVLFHIPQFFKNRGFPFFDYLPFFHKGTEAVYMFFSLSGFLIIRQLYIEKTNTNSIDLKAFFFKADLENFPFILSGIRLWISILQDYSARFRIHF